MHDILDLARMHVESLYELDADGRIVRVREPEANRPPQFALVRTTEGHTALVGRNVRAATASRLLALADREPPLGDPQAPPAHAGAYAEALSERAPLDRTRAGPAFALPAGLALPEGVTRVSSENRTLLERHFPWALSYLDVHDPAWVVVEDGAAVAICRSAREPSSGIEASVFTAEEYRGRGYARRVAAAWAHELSERGHVPLYSTWWENVASRRIAERLGGKLYAVDFSIR